MTMVDETLITDQEIAEFVTVTPDVAQKWLGLNTSNRKVKAGNVSAFAGDMANGRWKTNGEAIKLAGPPLHPSKLLDGQNRLMAVLRAGIPVRMLVVFGVDETAQATMDSGAKRSVADNLTIAGTKNASIVAAAAGLAIRLDEAQYGTYSAPVSNARALEYIEENPDLLRSAAVASTYAMRADAAKSLVAYTHWRFSRLDLGDATAFWRDAAEKVGLTSGDPVLAIANRFAQARRAKERYLPAAAVAATFRAWNARRTGQPLRSVAFTPVGATGLPRIK